MKNILTIKRLSSVLLVGMMVFANSPIKTEASFKPKVPKSREIVYLHYDENGNCEVVRDWGSGNTSIQDLVCAEDKRRYFWKKNGEKIDGDTPVNELLENGENAFCVSNNLINDKDLAKIRYELTPKEITANFYNTKTGNGSSRKMYAFESDEVRTFFDNFDYDNKCQVIMGNGQRVNDLATFKDLMNQNGNNEFTIYDTDNPNLLPTSSRRNRK